MQCRCFVGEICFLASVLKWKKLGEPCRNPKIDRRVNTILLAGNSSWLQQPLRYALRRAAEPQSRHQGPHPLLRGKEVPGMYQCSSSENPHPQNFFLLVRAIILSSSEGALLVDSGRMRQTHSFPGLFKLVEGSQALGGLFSALQHLLLC